MLLVWLARGEETGRNSYGERIDPVYPFPLVGDTAYFVPNII
jgi:hypothetical protein